MTETTFNIGYANAVQMDSLLDPAQFATAVVTPKKVQAVHPCILSHFYLVQHCM